MYGGPWIYQINIAKEVVHEAMFFTTPHQTDQDHQPTLKIMT